MGICGVGMHSHLAHLAIVMTDWWASRAPTTPAVPRQESRRHVLSKP
jgi:hypothetical protein